MTDDEKRQQAGRYAQAEGMRPIGHGRRLPEAELETAPTGEGHNRSDLATKAQATLDRLPARR